MKFNFLEYLESFMANTTDILTKVRPIQFVRQLQFYLVLVTLTMVTYFLASPYLGQEKIDLGEDGSYSVGNVSPESIISNKEIIYDDLDKTKLKKAEAYKSASLVFERDYSVLITLIQNYIDEDFDNLKVIAAEGNTNRNIGFLVYKNIRWKFRSREDLEFLLNYPRKDKLKELVQKGTNLIFSSYCILKDVSPDVTNSLGLGVHVINKGAKENTSTLDATHVFPRTAIYQNKKVQEKLSKHLDEKLTGIDSNTLTITKRMILSTYIYSFPACVYKPEETELQKQKEVAKVNIVKSKITKNEVIVKKGELVTPEIRTRLELLNEHNSRANINSILSILIVQIILVSIIIVFLIKYDPKRLNDVSSNVILFSTIWILTLYTFTLSKFFYHPDNNFESVYYFGIFIPIAMICMLIAFIFDEQLSIALGFYLSFFIFLSSQNNATSFIIAFSTTVVAAMYGSRIRKRIDFIKSGIYIAGVQILVATSGYLIDSRQYWVTTSSGSFLSDLARSNIFKIYIACIVNGFACALMTQFLLPVYEYIFNIPTRFKLQELADTGHPLLQALLTKAPSTYTHTFMVAALSERAAQNLGLDWLLVRVGVYFHDIGKIPNAGFFVENQHLIPKKENIDKNNPGHAAKIVIDHVIDGIEMAKKARLPREIISFIPEHHGTSTMAFFYHKALADLSPNQRKRIDKRDFMYPGPKPQRKETAIVMIADSVEAASRSLDEITPQALDDLIQKIINIKLAENQLDECDLTLGDLSIIKSSFKEILLSSLHQRPKYPSSEDTKKLENKEDLNKKETPAKKMKVTKSKK
ncbi:MAG: HDIG domain-containing protein [Leptospiraceae bacterium]|nr:HDIG domain-containing protein [Leptospiraceae bacterium]